MNSNIRDAGNYFLSVPVVQLRQTVGQAIANNTPTTILWDTEEIDSDNWHSTVSNTDQVTPQTSGRVQFSATVTWPNNSTGLRSIAWQRDAGAIGGGIVTIAPLSGDSTYSVARVHTQFFNGSTDFFTVQVTQTSGGSLTTIVSPVSSQSTLSARWVSAN